ncbi:MULTISPECIES: hypothetical protein [Methanobacterium]|uniref:hypothetical protein n=1 Tax=Methanobacterium TaxID=2160 RepID=UPI0015B4BAD8|nr:MULTISPECIES: hypothetical protein [Methanobacterium]
MPEGCNGELDILASFKYTGDLSTGINYLLNYSILHYVIIYKNMLIKFMAILKELKLLNAL